MPANTTRERVNAKRSEVAVRARAEVIDGIEQQTKVRMQEEKAKAREYKAVANRLERELAMHTAQRKSEGRFLPAIDSPRADDAD